MRVVTGLMFFPRGGSAQVTRALAGKLPAHGWDVTVLSGSLRAGMGDARAFYSGLDVRIVDFDAGDAPMHPSYEDRPGAVDACFARVDDRIYRDNVTAWVRALERAGAADADVLHLNHLTPLNEAAALAAPGVPIVGHLHGTELLLLEQIAAGTPATWKHADAWAERMRRWAQRCERIVLLSESQRGRAEERLGVERDACVVIGNGFDGESFRPVPVDRAALWRRELVERPRGWRPGAGPGSVAYSDDEVAVLADGVVLIAVGRFTEVKRVPLLVEAFERARRRARTPSALVLVGGHPGEWEGEHPLDTVERIGARDVFLAGWHDHDELPAFFNAADAQVLASVREQFGLVLVEGMACGLPSIAVDRFGPAEIVEDGSTGWLVPPDDEVALAAAIEAAIEDGDERERRGGAARRAASERWGWSALAGEMARVLEEAAAARPRASTIQP
ncbi:MAG: glycosyltransferase family 4 protein [Thermoleophilaceae bacterium]